MLANIKLLSDFYIVFLELFINELTINSEIGL